MQPIFGKLVPTVPITPMIAEAMSHSSKSMVPGARQSAIGLAPV